MGQQFSKTLVNKAIAAAVKEGSSKKLFLGGKGLYLNITKTGSATWYRKFRLKGKETRTSYGSYPENSYEMVMSKLLDPKVELDAKTKPRDTGNPEQSVIIENSKNDENSDFTFRKKAWDWFDSEKDDWGEKHKTKMRGLLVNHLLDAEVDGEVFGDKNMHDINHIVLYAVLKKMEDKKVGLSTHLANRLVGNVFEHASFYDDTLINPAPRVQKKLKARPPVKNYPTILVPRSVGRLMVGIQDHLTTPEVSYCIKLSPYFFQRPGQNRKLEWDWVKWKLREIHYPPGAMKKDHEHILPIADQAYALLEELHNHTGHEEFAFYSSVAKAGYISEASVGKQLKLILPRVGLTDEEIVPHGFRSMAETMLLDEVRFLDKDKTIPIQKDWIEVQIAHKPYDPNEGAYNKAKYLEFRRQLVQVWADYLDELREEARKEMGDSYNYNPTDRGKKPGHPK